MFIHYRTTVLLAEVSCVVVVVSVAVVVVSVVVGCWRMKGNAYQAEMGYGRLPPLCVICGMRDAGANGCFQRSNECGSLNFSEVNIF